jgi:tRNA(Ile)-lysidine synthase
MVGKLTPAFYNRSVMANKKQQPNLEQRVLEFISRHKLIEAGQKILVAVSGGPDSVSLLDILLKLQTELNITLHIAHLNHQLRGEESEADARYVEELAKKLNLPATIEKRDVTAFQSENHLSVEEAAREVRYHFLAETATQTGADRVAVGHTQNDQIETIMLHIIRGTGTRGLRGLQPCQELQFSGRKLMVVRPLLEISREETLKYCSLRQLSPCLDSSNLSLSMLRNRVRHELLPLLHEYNPGINDSLLRISRIAQDDLEFLELQSVHAWKEIVNEKEKSVVLNKKSFLGLAPALKRQLVRRAIGKLLGTLKDIETRHIEEILGALQKPAGRKIILPEGLIFSIEYDRYILGFKPESLVPFPDLKGEFEIEIPGTTRIPGWTIEAKIISRDSFKKWSVEDNFTGCFDKDCVGTKIKVRTRRRGDWFQPLGMDQTKKIGEFMLDARIPRLWRESIPIFLTPQQVVWVAGWRIDERVKITQNTKRVLCLRLVRWSDEQHREGGTNC